MIKYNNTNNASTTLTAGISPSSTTLIVENGDILPTAPFLLTLEHFDNEKVTVREIVKCIAKAGNFLTIQRGAGTCVQDDSASTKEQGNSAHSFSVGDCASIYWTSEQVQDIQNEIEKKLNIDDFQAGTYVYGATSTGTDAYSITIPGTLTSYAVGQVFRFMADVDNEGNATLNINGLGAVEIRKNHDKILDNGDIEAGQIVEVAYDGTYFQMDSQVATVVDIASLGNTQRATGVAGEDLEAGVACYMVDYSKDELPLIEVGKDSTSTDFEVIGSGETSDNIHIRVAREGSTSGEDLTVSILDNETVVASGTITRSSTTADTTENVVSFGEEISLTKGKVYTLRLSVAETSSSNYYLVNKRKQLSFWDFGVYAKGNVGEYTMTNIDITNISPFGYNNKKIYNNFDFVYTSGSNLTFKMYNGTNAFSITKDGTTLKNNYNESVSITNTTYNLRIKYNNGKVNFFFKLPTDNSWNVLGTEHTQNWTGLYPYCDYDGTVTIESMYCNEIGNTGCNFNKNIFATNLFYQIDSYDKLTNTLISTSSYNKGDDAIFETKGISNLFKGGNGYLFVDTDGTITNIQKDYYIGEYDNLGNFVYVEAQLYDIQIKSGTIEVDVYNTDLANYPEYNIWVPKDGIFYINTERGAGGSSSTRTTLGLQIYVNRKKIQILGGYSRNGGEKDTKVFGVKKGDWVNMVGQGHYYAAGKLTSQYQYISNE